MYDSDDDDFNFTKEGMRCANSREAEDVEDVGRTLGNVRTTTSWCWQSREASRNRRVQTGKKHVLLGKRRRRAQSAVRLGRARRRRHRRRGIYRSAVREEEKRGVVREKHKVPSTSQNDPEKDDDDDDDEEIHVRAASVRKVRFQRRGYIFFDEVRESAERVFHREASTNDKAKVAFDLYDVNETE